MNERLIGDILAVCDTLGVTSDDGKYLRDPQCLSSAKDLILYLRRDTNEHTVRRLLGDTQIVQKDLIPIYKLEDTPEDILQVVLRLLVNLTNPPILLYEREIPNDHQPYILAITKHLQAYKISFVDEDFWRALTNRLSKLIEDMELILEEQTLIVERMLILTRNVLQVPANPSDEMRNDDDVSVHDQILWVLQRSGMFDLILFISSSESTKEFAMHMIEILSLIVREHTGGQLAKTRLNRNQLDALEDARELRETAEKEAERKHLKPQASRSFKGTFVIKGVKTGTGSDQICHKPVKSFSDLSLDAHKKLRKVAKNRQEIVEGKQVRRSTVGMRLLLKEFCTGFLSNGYNQLMMTVKNRLLREQTQENDEIYYCIVLRFFMEFNRYEAAPFSVSRVGETIGNSTFHYVQTLVTKYEDLMKTDKENMKSWSKRMHTALRSYQELLNTLYVMDLSGSTKEAARLIQSHVYYLPEYRELPVRLLSIYEPRKFSRNYLCDLVELNHTFLKMLEIYSKEKKMLVRGRSNRWNDDDEEEQDVHRRESEFDFLPFVDKYSKNNIIATYAYLLKQFDSISELTFHCVVKMFHRLVFDLEYPAILCQASIFQTFQSILKVARVRPHLKVAVDFFKHFWSKWVKLATDNPKMFMEILFWKNGKEAMEIQDGYKKYTEEDGLGSQKAKKKNSRREFTPEEENEVLVLSEEYSKLPPEKGRKQVDWINERLIGGPKVKTALLNYLKEKGLIQDKIRKFKKRGKSFETSNELSNEQIGSGSSSEDYDVDNIQTVRNEIKERLAEDPETQESKRKTPSLVSSEDEEELNAQETSRRERKRPALVSSEDEDELNAQETSKRERKRPALVSSEDEEESNAAESSRGERKTSPLVSSEDEEESNAAESSRGERKTSPLVSSEDEEENNAEETGKGERKTPPLVSSEDEEESNAAESSRGERKTSPLVSSEDEEENNAEETGKGERNTPPLVSSEDEEESNAEETGKGERKTPPLVSSEDEDESNAEKTSRGERKRIYIVSSDSES